MMRGAAAQITEAETSIILGHTKESRQRDVHAVDSLHASEKLTCHHELSDVNAAGADPLGSVHSKGNGQ